MSHSVVITLDNIKTYVETCDSLINDCNNLMNIEWIDKSIIKKLILQIEEIKSELLSKENGVAYNNHEVEKLLSSITKKASNLKYNLNLREQLVKYMEKDLINIDQKIAENGSMAINVINYLNENKISIDEKSFSETLDKIRQLELSKNELSVFHKSALKQLDDSDIPSDIKFEISKIIRKTKTAQEISDVPAYIESKKQEYSTVRTLMKDVVLTFNKLNFTRDKGIIWNMNDEQELVSKLSFTNKTNNTVNIYFYSSGKFKYKLGNYVGHACEKTSEKLWSQLEQNGYIIKDKKIRRDIDNSQPLAKAIKSNERNR